MRIGTDLEEEFITDKTERLERRKLGKKAGEAYKIIEQIMGKHHLKSNLHAHPANQGLVSGTNLVLKPSSAPVADKGSDSYENSKAHLTPVQDVLNEAGISSSIVKDERNKINVLHVDLTQQDLTEKLEKSAESLNIKLSGFGR